MLKFLNKYRKEASWGAVLLLTVIAFIAHAIVPGIGLPLSMAGLVALVGLFVLSALVALLYELIFIGKQMFVKYLIVAFSVLIIASWVTPIAQWIIQILPI